MYDALLFLHVLSAAIVFITVVMFSAYALGAPVGRANFAIADWAWNISGAGLVIFGVWLTLYLDGYELWDGWILGALVLFGLASWFGARARTEAMALLPGGDGQPGRAQVTMWHWLRAASVVAILVLMIWKPGA